MTSENWFINDQNAVYFLTFTIVDWVDVFTRKEYKNVISDSLNYCIENKGLEVYAWCLMSNHLHLVCRNIENFRISDTVRDFKKFTAAPPRLQRGCNGKSFLTIICTPAVSFSDLHISVVINSKP